MMCTYTATAALGYAVLGVHVPSFLPDAMPHGWGRVLIGLLIAFHTAVCYLIVAQPLHAQISAWVATLSIGGGGGAPSGAARGEPSSMFRKRWEVGRDEWG